MSTEEINYKDLSQSELNKLKNIYVDSRLKEMSETDLRKFVRSVIDDQIKGTVGNEEEKEAWKEMQDHFQDSFIDKLKEVKKSTQASITNQISPEEKEFNRRIEMVEKLKKENEDAIQDMW